MNAVNKMLLALTFVTTSWMAIQTVDAETKSKSHDELMKECMDKKMGMPEMESSEDSAKQGSQQAVVAKLGDDRFYQSIQFVDQCEQEIKEIKDQSEK